MGDDVTAVPAWVPFLNPKEAHHAAFEAYVHRDTRARLVLLWLPRGTGLSGMGTWVWRLLDGQWADDEAERADRTLPPFEWAEAEIRGRRQEGSR